MPVSNETKPIAIKIVDIALFLIPIGEETESATFVLSMRSRRLDNMNLMPLKAREQLASGLRRP